MLARVHPKRPATGHGAGSVCPGAAGGADHEPHPIAAPLAVQCSPTSGRTPSDRPAMGAPPRCAKTHTAGPPRVRFELRSCRPGRGDGDRRVRHRRRRGAAHANRRARAPHEQPPNLPQGHPGVPDVTLARIVCRGCAVFVPISRHGRPWQGRIPGVSEQCRPGTERGRLRAWAPCAGRTALPPRARGPAHRRSTPRRARPRRRSCRRPRRPRARGGRPRRTSSRAHRA